MVNQTVGAPGVDLDAWGEPLDCDCKDIWYDTGMPVWDSSANYMQNAVVEWPAGSNTLYISFDHGNVEPGSASTPTFGLLVTETSQAATFVMISTELVVRLGLTQPLLRPERYSNTLTIQECSTSSHRALVLN